VDDGEQMDDQLAHDERGLFPSGDIQRKPCWKWDRNSHCPPLVTQLPALYPADIAFLGPVTGSLRPGEAGPFMPKTREAAIQCQMQSWLSYRDNSSSNAFAACKSAVSNPSVHQP
jgi:hypothetical protein